MPMSNTNIFCLMYFIESTLHLNLNAAVGFKEKREIGSSSRSKHTQHFYTDNIYKHREREDRGWESRGERVEGEGESYRGKGRRRTGERSKKCRERTSNNGMRKAGGEKLEGRSKSSTR